ncbi:hypothetical protein J4477_01555 [Candidatus Pacearchaeota archaeon]|nr:hypothetical protein [Candidatus Pacearchaeota archaeon]
MLSRREFIKNISGLLSCALIEGSSFAYAEQNIEGLVDNFPDLIPGVKKVMKFKTPDSKYCLVHIRQLHAVPWDLSTEESMISTYTTFEEKVMINNCQNDIYDMLSYLTENHDLNSVFVEGISPNVFERMQKDRNYFEELVSFEDTFFDEELSMLKREAKTFLDDISKFPAHIPEGMTQEQYVDSISSRVAVLEKEVEDIKDKFRFYHGAALRLGYEGKLDLKIFESKGGLEKAEEELRRGEYGKHMLDDREDELLLEISKLPNGLHYAVLGGAHAFGGRNSFGREYIFDRRISYRDNIYEWNIKNPNSKFSLIEVTPKNLPIE